MSIKVCHMSSAHLNTDRRIFVAECTALAEAGYEVYLIACGKSREDRGVHVIGMTNSGLRRIERITRFAKAVYKKALELDCDIYHFHDPELLPYGIKLKRKGKKVIFDSHELYTAQIPEKPYLPKWISGILAKCYGTYENYVLKNIDGVIYPCLMQGINPFQEKCKNVALVNNTPYLSEMFDKYNPDIKKYDKSVCYVGTISYERGITHLIKAVYQAGAVLYLGGKFSQDSYREEIENMSEYKCVRYQGILNRNEVINLISHCMIGAASGLYLGQYGKCDNLATKAYEYMSLAIPLIVLKSDYVERLLKEYPVGIMTDFSDINATADAISYLINNPKEAEKMGKAGRCAVYERFNWDRDKENLLELYEKIFYGTEFKKV